MVIWSVASSGPNGTIAICITIRNGADSPIEESIQFGLATASWQENGRRYMVIGGQNAALIRQVAAQVQKEI